MFCSDIGANARLARCDLFGNECVTIATNAMVTTGLAVDRFSGLLYFTDTLLDYIYVVTENGEDKQIVVRFFSVKLIVIPGKLLKPVNRAICDHENINVFSSQGI